MVTPSQSIAYATPTLAHTSAGAAQGIFFYYEHQNESRGGGSSSWMDTMLVAESTCFSVLGMLKMLYATTRSWRRGSGTAAGEEEDASEPWESSAKELDGVEDVEGGDEKAVSCYNPTATAKARVARRGRGTI